METRIRKYREPLENLRGYLDTLEEMWDMHPRNIDPQAVLKRVLKETITAIEAGADVYEIKEVFSKYID